MSDLQEKLELQMRLGAIEQVLCNMQATLMVGNGVSMSEIDAIIDEGMTMANRQTFPSLHPAQSDLAAAAWQEAILRLSNMTREAAKELAQRMRG